jgi:hypothetical protein
METDQTMSPAMSVAQAKAALSARADEAQIAVDAARAVASRAAGRVVTGAVVGVSDVLAARAVMSLFGGGRAGGGDPPRAGASEGDAGSVTPTGRTGRAGVVAGLARLGLGWIAARATRAVVASAVTRLMGDRVRQGGR